MNNAVLVAVFKIAMYQITIICFLLAPFFSFGQPVECPASDSTLASVDFNSSQCRAIDLSNYQMRGAAVWLKLPLAVPQQTQLEQTFSERDLGNELPLGLFISGNMSLSAYLNSHFIGSKGKPAILKQDEIIGPFDWVGYVQKQYLLTDNSNNELILFVSSHNNLFSSHASFNRLYLDKFANTPDIHARHYAPSLVTMGVMLLAVFYLLAQKKYLPGKSKELPTKGKELPTKSKEPGQSGFSPMLVCLLVIALLQLLVEVSRGFVAYAYPLHIVRLNAILLLSFAFGQQYLFYCLKLTHSPKRPAIMVGSILLTIVSIMLLSDFDHKAIIAMLVPTAISLISSGLALFWGKYVLGKCGQFGAAVKERSISKNPTRFICACSGLLLVTMLTKTAFLDVYFYLFIAVLLLLLSKRESEKAQQLAKSLEASMQEAEKLELALAMRAGSGEGRVLKIKSSGRLLNIPAKHILYCKAAGDYVEIVSGSKESEQKTELYSGSLRQLTGQLPSGFLKVHRSYLVNASHIHSLKRSPSGNGELRLESGDIVPVSRTLFSQIKAALA